MSTITYIYGNLSEVRDYSGVTGKITLEKNPFLIPNMKVRGYNTSPSSITFTYYPLQLIDVPNSDLTLYAAMVDAGRVQVKNGSTITDISDMVLNVVQKKGKNQPFSYVTLTISRQMFLDANIEMTQKSTEFILNIFGITGTWIYERLEDNGSWYEITLVNKAYYLKNITLLSLFNFTFSYDVGGTTHVDDTKIGLTNLGFVYVDATHDYRIALNLPAGASSPWVNDEATLTIPFDGRSLIISIKRNIFQVSGGTHTDYALTKIVNCNPDDLFYFLAKFVAGYTQTSQIIIQPGYYYNVPSISVIDDTYLMEDIENLKAGAKNPITNQSVLTRVSLRLDEFAWDILQSLAYLSNREIIFDNIAFFGPLLPPEEGQSEINLSIDWEPPTDPVGGTTYITTMALAENDDQGSQYLIASQKVVSEAYETTVAISDTTSSYVGNDIKFLGADATSQSSADNTNRNIQAKIVALNALVKNFKPGDCIEYSVNETVYPTATATISDWSEFNSLPASTTCFLFQQHIFNSSIVATETYYIKKNGLWYEYDSEEPERDSAFDVTSCVNSISDAHNNVTLTDCPVALITVEYPACVTTYTWGNPEFMDEQSQFRDLSAVSQDTVLDNTSDTGISSGDATKLVVGNQYVHQLRDDRAGFTGLIMEKNLDNDVFRLVGYNKGIPQAQFNSEGKIEAGAGVAILDEDGLTINYDSEDTSYNPQNALKFQKIDVSGVDSEGNPLTPYRLFAKYDSSTHTTTSIVQAQDQTINNTLFPSTLKMMCDEGGAYGKFTQYTVNRYNTYLPYPGTLSSKEDYLWLALYDSTTGYTEVTPSNVDSLDITPGVTDAYQKNINFCFGEYGDDAVLRTYSDPDWTVLSSQNHLNPSDLFSGLLIGSGTYKEVRVRLSSDSNIQSVSVTTPTTESVAVPCALVAYLENGTSFVFKNFSDSGVTSRGIKYIFSTGISSIKYVGFRFRGGDDGVKFYFDAFPVNIYRVSGTGASISLDREGPVIQGNNTINGQLYQSGGAVYFKGAGSSIPTYFDMPIVPQSVISRGGVSGSTIVARGSAALNSLACRNIMIVTEGSTPSGTFNVGDIILFYTP